MPRPDTPSGNELERDPRYFVTPRKRPVEGLTLSYHRD